MIFIWNIFLSQSTFNTRNHLFLSTRKVVKSFYLLNCTSACNFNSFETTKTLFFPYVRYFCREIFFHKLRFISSYTFFFFFNKILRYIFNISTTFCTTVCQIFEIFLTFQYPYYTHFRTDNQIKYFPFLIKILQKQEELKQS